VNVNTTGMTAGQRIMAEIISSLIESNGDEIEWKDDIDAENVDKAWSSFEHDDLRQDAEQGFREGTEETNLDCDWSRHYESKAVATQLSDGTWVGWTYWYGGGKHGEPSAMPWLDDAYFVNCVEEEKVVTVRTWSLVAATSASTTKGGE
jgi:hypothetical protein